MTKPILWLPTALLALCVNACAATAQTTPTDQVPPCQTNVGTQGEMLDGYQGMITAPEGFERVTTDAKQLEVFPDLRNGPAVLARGHAQPSGAADSAAIPVAFLSATGEPLLTCAVHILPFDPDRHSLARMKVGN